MKVVVTGDCTGAVQDFRNVTCEPVITVASKALSVQHLGLTLMARNYIMSTQLQSPV